LKPDNLPCNKTLPMTDYLKILRVKKKKERPLLSVIIAFFNMEREAPRTLFTLSTNYQKGVAETDYEVIAVDCGSTIPLEQDMVRSFGKNFFLVRYEFEPSPVRSVNKAAKLSKGRMVMICIDGARLLSPGILFQTLAAFRAFNNPMVVTINLHLGTKPQKYAMIEGYNQQIEDKMLDSVNWMNDGYELFRISCLAGSGRNGWFSYITESNCLTLSRSDFNILGGMCEEFKSSGGGFANCDLFFRATELPGPTVMLIGEGTFHQFHNGTSTNAPMHVNPLIGYKKEYDAIRPGNIIHIDRNYHLMGTIPPQAYDLIKISADKLNQEPTT